MIYLYVLVSPRTPLPQPDLQLESSLTSFFLTFIFIVFFLPFINRSSSLLSILAFCWLTLSFNIFFPFLHPSPLPWCLPHPNSWVCVSSAVRQRHHITWQVGRLTLSCTSWDPHCSLANPASVAGSGNICYFNYQNDVF